MANWWEYIEEWMKDSEQVKLMDGTMDEREIDGLAGNTWS